MAGGHGVLDDRGGFLDGALGPPMPLAGIKLIPASGINQQSRNQFLRCNIHIPRLFDNP